MRIAFLFLIMIIFMVYIGQMVATASPKLVLVLIGGLVLSMLTIMNLEWGLYILIFVIPFTMQVHLGKTIEAGTDDLLLLFLIFSWLANRARAKEDIFVSTPLNWPFFLFFVSGIVSLIPLSLKFSQIGFLVGSLHLLKFFEYVFIYFIVVSCVKEFSQVKKFTVAFFINVGIVTSVQIIQNLIGGPLQLGITYLKHNIVRYAVGTFESNAILGAFHCFALSILAGFILTIRSPKIKVILTICSIVISFTLFNTFSRSAYVGIVGGLFILAALKEKRLFLLLLALLIMSPMFMQAPVLERVTLTVQRLKPTVELDPSAEIRIHLWRKTFEIFMRNPIFGVGYWGVRYILGTEAHSQYWAYLTEMGIVGFSIFLWLMARIFKIALWVKKNTHDNFMEGLSVGYIAGLFAVLMTCFFSESLEAFRILGPLWFMTGLVVSVRNITLNQATQAQTPKS
ncbi:MAG: hypothetical protein AMJ78_04630 [Omnitrophica WOR_2 bacterium SM23_29]|nr:MAG: hypothetical protein AMJ78_04630 [Omnitrophica WOR_2 bacterium SM23_29]